MVIKNLSNQLKVVWNIQNHDTYILWELTKEVVLRGGPPSFDGGCTAIRVVELTFLSLYTTSTERCPPLRTTYTVHQLTNRYIRLTFPLINMIHFSFFIFAVCAKDYIIDTFHVAEHLGCNGKAKARSTSSYIWK